MFVVKYALKIFEKNLQLMLDISNTTKYHKIILKIQNICAIILIVYKRMGELMLWKIIWKIG